MDHEAKAAGSGTAPMQMDALIRLGVLALVLYLAVDIVRPFAGIMLWAAILTVTMYPVFSWIRRHTGNRGLLAAVVVTLVSLVLVFGPVAYLATSLVRSLEQLLHVVKTSSYAMPALPDSVTSLPVVGDEIVKLWALGGENLIVFVKEHAHTLMVPGEWLLTVIEGLAGIVLTLGAAVVVSGFLFVPGARLVVVADSIASRAIGPSGERFVALAMTTVRNVGRGVVGISALASLLLGLVFLAAGIPHAGVLTLLALMLSAMQIGTMYVAFPVAGWVWLAHEPLKAVLVTIVVVLICVFEHFAKPLIMGRGTETPTLVLFLGVLGGLAVYGLAGLFIGPLVFALTYELVRVWLAQTPQDGA